MYSILLLAFLSFLFCYALTPLVGYWSRRQGWVDVPSKRKLHTEPMPRTGGIAIASAYVLAVGALLMSPLNGGSAVDVPLALKLLPAIGVIFAVGVLDDIVGIRPWQKLAFQLVAAVLAYSAGVAVTGFAGVNAVGWWTLPITMLWLVACTNAFNLIDGVDGLAAGVGLFATLTTLIAALLQGNSPLAMATAPLAGALLAFLRYNFNPASIFLGDSGSLTIGFVLGCFGAIWSQKSATLLGMTAPLMALAVPLLDTGIAVARRFLRHQPIFTADRNHMHHRLLARGLSPRQVALTIYGFCGLAASFSLVQTMPDGRFDGIVLIVFCAAAALGIYFIGWAEFDTATRLIGAGTFRGVLNARLFSDSVATRFSTASTPEEYWQVVRDISRELKCVGVRVSLWGEVFEETTDPGFKGSCADLRIPLSAGYVNFRYPSELSVRHGVALSAMVDILQRTLLAQAPLHLSAARVREAHRSVHALPGSVPVTVNVSAIQSVAEVDVL